MSKISLGHIIAEVQNELGLSDSSTTALFKVWAYDAQRSIGYSELYTKETVWKNLEGNAIKKPKDMAIPITVSLSSNKQDCVEPVFRGDFSKCGCTTNYNSSCEIAMGENDVEFYFSDNNYRYAKIKYVSHPVDENGEPLLDEANARAIKQYINYMYTRRERKKNRKSVPQSEVDSEYQIWVRLRNEAIGESNMPKPHQMKEIGEKWMNTGITPKDVIDSRYGDWYRGTSCSTSGSSSSSSSGSSVPSDYNFTDKYAIHTNVANEILGLVELSSPTGLEYLVAEKEDGTKVRIKVSNLPTASGGEVNTASNAGASGVGVFDAKDGVDLEFRNLASTNNLLSIALDAANKVIEFTVNEANISITESQISDLTKLDNVRLAFSDTESDLVAHASDKVAYWDATYNGTVTGFVQSVGTAPTGQAIVVDILKNGVSILTTLSSIDATEVSSLTASAPMVIDNGSFVVGDRITFVRTQVGNGGETGKWHQGELIITRS